jgi:hypothetical protein
VGNPCWKWARRPDTIPTGLLEAALAAPEARQRLHGRHGGDGFETKKIFWPGDRIEWILARRFHDGFFDERRAHRVLWPGPA